MDSVGLLLGSVFSLMIIRFKSFCEDAARCRLRRSFDDLDSDRLTGRWLLSNESTVLECGCVVDVE